MHFNLGPSNLLHYHNKYACGKQIDKNSNNTLPSPNTHTRTQMDKVKLYAGEKVHQHTRAHVKRFANSNSNDWLLSKYFVARTGTRQYVCSSLSKWTHSKCHRCRECKVCSDSRNNNNNNYYYDRSIVKFRINESINIFTCITRAEYIESNEINK